MANIILNGGIFRIFPKIGSKGIMFPLTICTRNLANTIRQEKEGTVYKFEGRKRNSIFADVIFAQ